MSLEDRVAALEDEVTRLREQVTDTHSLAAHADRDVAEFRAELRAQTRLINLTRQDMLAHGQRLDALQDDVRSLDGKVRSLQGEMRSGFATVNDGMTQIVRLLERLNPEEGN
jgi:chromosome segregation ATPase